jgi:O-6-methylguanine DNA methyltransferase
MTSPGWTAIATALGPVLVAADGSGIVGIDLPGSGMDAGSAAAARWPGLPRADGRLPPAWMRAVAAAAAGRAFDCPPLVLMGTPFQRRVWDALRAIPRGEVRTYGRVAAMIGAPRAVRAVAGACGANPVALLVPCHRVVAADGIGGYSAGAGLAAKRALLAAEGALTDPG